MIMKRRILVRAERPVPARAGREAGGAPVGFLLGVGSDLERVPGRLAGRYFISFDAAQRGNYQASQQNFEVLEIGRAHV